MRALVVYESMYGNTRAIAESIAMGLRAIGEVTIRPAADVVGADLDGWDVLVLGGPTHAHGMSRPRTREAAVNAPESYGTGLTVEPNASGSGIRELLDGIERVDGQATAFDTRMRAPAWLTGRAAKGIARHLRRRGASMLAPPESFLVNKRGRLVNGEQERALAWGAHLATALRDAHHLTSPT
jgi:hypothetical protein